MLALSRGKVTGICGAGVLVITQAVICNIYTFVINFVAGAASDHTAVYKRRTGAERHTIAGIQVTGLYAVAEQVVITFSVRGASGLNVFRSNQYNDCCTQNPNQ
jgi:hypothetical protein